jgi:hypothetical protein
MATVLLLSPHIVWLRDASSTLLGRPPLPRPELSRVLPPTNGRIYRSVGNWLNANAPPGAVAAVGDLGIIGYYADRGMVDYFGILSDEVARALARKDVGFTIPHLMPEYVVLDAQMGAFGQALGQDRWFLSNYRKEAVLDDPTWRAPGMVIARRYVRPGAMLESPAALEVAPGLQLERFAFEEGRLKPGRGLRVRLDWRREPSFTDPVMVQVFINDSAGKSVVWSDVEMEPASWSDGTVASVYHRMFLDEAFPLGPHTLNIKVVLGDGTVVYRELAQIAPGADGEAHPQAP